MTEKGIEILLKCFSPWKLSILYILGKGIKNDEALFPILTSGRFLNKKNLFECLKELLETNNSKSLRTNYYGNLNDLFKLKIVEREEINQASRTYSYRFTVLGLEVVNFFSNVMEFFGYECFLEMFDTNKIYRKNRSHVFIDTLSRLVKITSFFKLRNKKELIFFGLNTRANAPVNINMLKKIIDSSRNSLEIYMESKERREHLNQSILSSFTFLLGKELDKVNLIDFYKLESVFNDWGLISEAKYYYFSPLEQVHNNIIKVLRHPNPTYACFNEGFSLEFCSQDLEDSSTSSGIFYEEELINSIFNLGYIVGLLHSILSIEDKLQLLSIRNITVPTIYLLVNNNRVFLFTSLEPLVWPKDYQNLDFWISLSNDDTLDYKFKKGTHFDLIKKLISNDFSFFKEVIEKLNEESNILVKYLSRNIFNKNLKFFNQDEYYSNKISMENEDKFLGSNFLSENYLKGENMIPVSNLNINFKGYSILSGSTSNGDKFLVSYKTENRIGTQLSKINSILSRV